MEELAKYKIYAKVAKNLKEGDVIRKYANSSTTYYLVETDAVYSPDDKAYLLWVTEISEDNLDTYLKDSTLPPDSRLDNQEEIRYTNSNQYVACVD